MNWRNAFRQQIEQICLRFACAFFVVDCDFSEKSKKHIIMQKQLFACDNKEIHHKSYSVFVVKTIKKKKRKKYEKVYNFAVIFLGIKVYVSTFQIWKKSFKFNFMNVKITKNLKRVAVVKPFNQLFFCASNRIKKVLFCKRSKPTRVEKYIGITFNKLRKWLISGALFNTFSA